MPRRKLTEADRLNWAADAYASALDLALAVRAAEPYFAVVTDDEWNTLSDIADRKLRTAKATYIETLVKQGWVVP